MDTKIVSLLKIRDMGLQTHPVSLVFSLQKESHFRGASKLTKIAYRYSSVMFRSADMPLAISKSDPYDTLGSRCM